MKVSILGAGALGSMVGGLIKYHAPQTEMRFIAHGAHGEAMRRSGRVVLNGRWGSVSVPVQVSDSPGDLAGSEYVILTVKSQATEEALRQAAPAINGAMLISLQNGINQHVLARFLPPERFLVGVTATNMAIVEPGVVSLQRRDITVIGPPSPQPPCAAAAGALSLLQTSHLPVASSSNMLGLQYNKLLINSVGYASVLSDLDFITEGILDRAWRQIVARPLLKEGLATMRLAGINLSRLRGTADALRLARLLKIFDVPGADNLVRTTLRWLVRPARIVYSVYQDLVRGKPTEIDFVNGEIVRLAGGCGAAAPYNQLVVSMVHELEARGDGTFFSRAEVLARFRKLAA
jgi:2-dehydropantoate 2-reductase